ncbi:MAG: SEL1-like repeat protein, partial [Alphaproteobacteria bacterium]|nr:SEL1-like repeat protein [Alphaproteobacteria bacterium]
MKRELLGAAAGIGLIVLVIGGVAVFRTSGAPSSDQVAAQMQEAEAAYARGEYGRVAGLLEEPAEAGNPLAQFRLGMMYRQGFGVAVDRDEA